MKDLPRIALFGGTFDPVHLGHTGVSGYVASHLHADCVIFIPAGHPPLKPSAPKASGIDRLNMVQLAIADNPIWQASDCELHRTGPSYTIDTVRHFRGTYGREAILYWLIGADCVHDLPSWYQIEQLLRECTIVTMTRPGWPRPDFRIFEHLWPASLIRQLQEYVVQTPMIDISSSLIRSRIRSGQDVSSLLHPAVLDYIRQHRLYLEP
ncbi:MAG: nicotinate (nicotinamide) nucleotide adenylyltransferase [Sedimentisphaerales bacterium]|nr:nicotinate (nicotinamide) nucleotide adenylyltransferase [Sedimentisphaerales bacterium]